MMLLAWTRAGRDACMISRIAQGDLDRAVMPRGYGASCLTSRKRQGGRAVMPDLQDPMRIGELAVMPALHLKDRDLAGMPDLEDACAGSDASLDDA